ncbi:hypothetical protein DY000_02000847 [Brassica cretica]|uniref:Uncharacterized protein n=1 Tax=Brassica cretica TaxID=69181 RepID=A0ABQ7CGH3_BRACR|nr:hypothetical protein DY000_02000847 [Brassica cretica]
MLSPATLTRKTPLPFNSLGFSGNNTSYFNRRRTLTEAGSSRALSFGHKLNCGGRVNWSGRSGTVLGHLGRVYSISGRSSGDSGGIGGSGDSSGGGGDEGSGGNGNKWYLALLSNYPVLTKAVTSAILTLIGDLICQVTLLLYLDHVNRLDNASGEHTRGTAIDEGLHGSPDTQSELLSSPPPSLPFLVGNRTELSNAARRRDSVERERERFTWWWWWWWWWWRKKRRSKAKA